MQRIYFATFDAALIKPPRNDRGLTIQVDASNLSASMGRLSARMTGRARGDLATFTC
jgi:hypothetical protein